MGRYINTDTRPKGEFFGKADDLIENHGAVEIAAIPTRIIPGRVLVNVVVNPHFDAAGIAYDQHELELMLHPDSRPQRWLEMDIERVVPFADFPDDTEKRIREGWAAVKRDAEECGTCWGNGLWGIGDAVPMGPMDAAGGMPTQACPECGANPNPPAT